MSIHFLTAAGVAALLLTGCVARENVAEGAVQLSHAPRGSVTVSVVATEFAFETSATQVSAGRVVLVLENRGNEVHELAVVPFDGQRYGLPIAEVEAVQPGKSAAVEVGLQPGAYRIVCLLTGGAEADGASHMSLGQEFELVARQ